MVCNQCGKQLADHTNYCEECKQFVRPITYNAYLAQEDAKELKELPDESKKSVSLSGSFLEQFLSLIKNPQNKMLSIAFAIASGLCMVLLIAFMIVLVTKNTSVSVTPPSVPVVSETNISPSDVSGSDIPSEKMKQIGSKEYGFIIIPDSWINATYDKTSTSIQYVSEDGKHSVTLAKSFKSESTLNKCASELQVKMEELSLNDIKNEKYILNDMSAYCVSGTYTTEDNQKCSVSSYLLMDENDNLFMITLASYGDLSELDAVLKSFSLNK